MDVYVRRDYVMQALTYVGTAEETDIIPLTLAAARNNVMKLPCRELEEIISQEIIENAKSEAVNKFAERLCEGRVENDPVVIAVKCELKAYVEGGSDNGGKQ